MHSDSLVIMFVKAPLRGTVKSRLAAGIGERAALDLYCAFTLDAADILESAGYPVKIHFSPAGAAGMVADMLGTGRFALAADGAGRRRAGLLSPQVGADLGERMERAFHEAFSEGWGSAVLIGSDIPELTEDILREAVAALSKNDAVIGPAADGGYYLIGFTRASLLPAAFHGIPWSSPAVYASTMHLLKRASRSVHVLPILHDIDSAEDLTTFWKRNRASGLRQSRTMKYLEENRKNIFGDF